MSIFFLFDCNASFPLAIKDRSGSFLLIFFQCQVVFSPRTTSLSVDNLDESRAVFFLRVVTSNQKMNNDFLTSYSGLLKKRTFKLTTPIQLLTSHISRLVVAPFSILIWLITFVALARFGCSFYSIKMLPLLPKRSSNLPKLFAVIYLTQRILK